jgi:hypothetical protein
MTFSLIEAAIYTARIRVGTGSKETKDNGKQQKV